MSSGMWQDPLPDHGFKGRLLPSDLESPDSTDLPKVIPFNTTSHAGLKRSAGRQPPRRDCFNTYCLYSAIFAAGVFTTGLIWLLHSYYYFHCSTQHNADGMNAKDFAVNNWVDRQRTWDFLTQFDFKGYLVGQRTEDFPEQLSPAAPAALCSDTCVLSLVESIPQNLTYDSGEVVHTPTYTALKGLLATAKQSVHIASYYWTLLGDDIAFHDQSAAEGEDIFHTLLQMSKANQVKVKIAQNQENNDTAVLASQGHAELRTLNFTHLIGAGILHTKFWLVDGQHFYVGSANLDWRSYTQVKEMGILVQNCPCLGADLQKIFDVYWDMGAVNASVPVSWPANYSTAINATNPVSVRFNHTQAPVYMASAPPQFCPAGRTGDIGAILDVIQKSKEFIYIAVMDYSPSSLYKRHNTYWPVIDDALRAAAIDRYITVRVLGSQWAHTKKDMLTYLCSLSYLAHLHYPKARIQVKMFEVPASPDQAKIPFARVNHNKYMVTDQQAYIGTSNWSEDYFTSTGGVGFVVSQPGNATQGNVRQQLHDVFMRDWGSVFSSNLICPNSTKSMD